MHFFLFSGTHWDREWYQNFQGFRYRLVNMLDHLVDYFETTDTKSVFHMDGQTIVLEDYAEINPEGFERLKKLIRQNRIFIGPWYCMPDEFLVSGEALIRNLAKGHEICDAIGAVPWKCGYICDIFGHMAQMPQILRETGIDSAVLGRGTNEHTTPPVFVWEAPDGSRVDTFKLPDNNGYGDFTGDVAGSRVAGFCIKAETDDFENRASKYIAKLKERANIPVMVLWDALDHEPFHEETQDYIKRLRELFTEDQFLQTNLLNAFALVHDRGGLPVLKGELRETGCGTDKNYIQILIHVLSSRQSLKMRNDRCQALLEKRLEPALLVFAHYDYHPRDAFRKTAWKYLLQNHPHDSICGCSIDRVHEDMAYRFSQTEAITETILWEGMWKITKGLRFAGGDPCYLTILKTSPMPVREVVELQIPFHQSSPKWHEPLGYEDIAAFRLFNPDGTEIPYAISGRKTGAACRGLGGSNIACDLYTVLMPLDLSGIGFTSIQVRPADKPVRFFGGFADAGGVMDNGILRVETNADGTINLMDYGTGKTYSKLLGLNDGAEIGDGWDHAAPVMDAQVFNTRLAEASVILNSPVAGRIRIVREMQVPAGMQTLLNGNVRTDETVTLHMEFVITLKKDARFLEVTLRFNNTARDHRLRLLLPTGVREDCYEANQNFAFIERKCKIDPDTHDWKEPAQHEAPMNGIVSRRRTDGTGLAFIAEGGLHECAAYENGDIAVTLLRAFARTPSPEREDGGQELFPHAYNFRLVPLEGEMDRAGLQNMQDFMAAGLTCSVTDEAFGDNLLQIKGNVCASAVKPAENGNGDWIIRLYNVGKNIETAEICTDFGFVSAYLCDMLENIREQLSIENGCIRLDIPSGRIMTIRCTTKDEADRK